MAPIRPPPGLEASRAAGQGACDKASLLAAMTEQVRAAFGLELEAEVAGRLSQVWEHGAISMLKVQEQNSLRAQEMLKTVTQLGAAQKAMEIENAQLRQVVAAVAAHVVHLGLTPRCTSPSDASTGAPTPFSCRSTASPTLSPTMRLQVALADAVTAPVPKAIVSLAAAMPQIPPPPQSAAPPMGLQPFALPPAPAGPPSLHSQATVKASALSLADASGLKANAVAGSSITWPATRPPSPPQSTEDAYIFSVTIRNPREGRELGLHLVPALNANHLRVAHVLSGGSVDAWNQRCCSEIGDAEQAIYPGDIIVSVNDISGDIEAALEETRLKGGDLHFQIVRNSKLLPAMATELSSASQPCQLTAGVPAPSPFLSLEALLASPKRGRASPPASPPPASPPVLPKSSNLSLSPPPAYSVNLRLNTAAIPKALASRFDSCEFMHMTVPVVKLAELVL